MEGGRGDGKQSDRGERGNDRGDGRNYSIIVGLGFVAERLPPGIKNLFFFAVGKQPSMPLIDLGRKWTLN